MRCLSLLRRSQLPKGTIEEQVVGDLCPAHHQRRLENHVLHQKARNRRTDSPENIARQIAYTAGKRPLVRQHHCRNVGLARGNVHFDQCFAAQEQQHRNLNDGAKAASIKNKLEGR
jgi:hypothetical protein